MISIYPLIGAVDAIFHQVKIKCKINTVCQLDQQVHRIAVATILQHWTYEQFDSIAQYETRFTFTQPHVSNNLISESTILDQEVTPHHLVVGAMLFKKAEGSVVSNRIRMKFGRNGLQVNTH